MCRPAANLSTLAPLEDSKWNLNGLDIPPEARDYEPRWQYLGAEL